MALRFVGNDDSDITCGNYDAGSATQVTVGGQTDPIPIVFRFDANGASFDAILVGTVDYTNLDASQACILYNNC